MSKQADSLIRPGFAVTPVAHAPPPGITLSAAAALIAVLGLLAGISLSSAARASETRIGTVTLAEGSSWLQRGSELFSVNAGLPLRKADVIETGEGSLAQVEFEDGSVLALGPASRLFIFDFSIPVPPRKDRLQVVLLRGWMKVAFGMNQKEKSDWAQLSTRELLTSTARATIVFHVAPSQTELFVESGSVVAAPLEARPKTFTVNEGQFAQRAAGADINISNALPEVFLTGIPRAFRDALPVLAPRLAGRILPPPTPLHEVSYEEVADLLTLPGRWRSGMVQRFETRADDEEFRRALERNLPRHREWDRILHPEKYELPDQPPFSAEPTKVRGANQEKSP